jgi:cysteine-rich repeat protein
MRCRLHRSLLILVAGVVTPITAGCGRSGLREGSDSATTPDLSRIQADTGGTRDVSPVTDDAVILLDLPDGSNGTESASLCGNGVLDPGEDCEDGNLLAGDGCDPFCHYDPDPYRNCGNGVIDPGEQCDDGNRVSGDGCSPSCSVEPGYYCPTPGKACLSPRFLAIAVHSCIP